MINEFKKPVLGQVMYRLNINNMARDRKQELTEVKVISIGRTYFTVTSLDFQRETVHHLEGGKEKTYYSPNYIIYETPEKWHEEKQRELINRKISRTFNYGSSRFSYDQLKRVADILFPEGFNDD